MLDFLRDNHAAVQGIRILCRDLLSRAASDLAILSPELGDEELINSVAVEWAKLGKV